MNYHLRPVADGVWAAIVDDEPPLARRLREDVWRLTGRDASILVNSHWHGDHVLGNQSFADVRIVSTARTKTLVETRTADRLEQNKERLHGSATATWRPGAASSDGSTSSTPKRSCRDTGRSERATTSR
jgi:glyoxylase-like metal-dependent hydrolase (beta-lactamase superfamily II)